ncbi:hypothetical protein K443DRAFT_134277 [Laccaria amethystina LaAM-08-1]|uniref:tRNA (uracil-O(2)-)-methyltransferase n=1 Tax=Laccaria amethystina LaAM-08-1 TaxID=1095629 RepID=A0A0C9WK75_9AGAR|nr:hypothetical protein K443DRAFT_134277 [Laccaria amethystina LaAM-08-1]
MHDRPTWTPIISCPVNFPIEIFEIAISQLIHHPEYNSTLILRSEVVEETESNFVEAVPRLEGYHAVQCIHRRLLPRRPGRDAALEQYCSLHASESGNPHTLILTPIVAPGPSLPYYHPSVSHLAFRYFHSPMNTDTSARLRIEALHLPNTSTDPNSRLYRTFAREAYQDLYLIMRERHKGLVDTWREVTDPLKHVFEDIGIATYLMFLWKDTFSTSGSTVVDSAEEPWKSWPRPPGGFLDLGCGNGLLTHILTAEGYVGSGVDLRARASWSHYPVETQAQLHVHAFDPTDDSLDPSFTILRNTFIIDNHADELTPWVPVLATLHDAAGYLSIPCCAWAFDAKFERANSSGYPLPEGIGMTKEQFIESLNLGGDGSNTSSYSMYRIWLATLSVHCGWVVECETLRIPSTRNWAVVGRKRLGVVRPERALDNVRAIVEDVKKSGVFKTRKPEGKAGDY